MTKALHEIDEFAVAKNRNCGRRGRVAIEVAAGAVGGFAILTGKDCDLVVGLACCVRQGQPNAGAHLAAAQPHIEFTTNIVVPGRASAESTSSAVFVSSMPGAHKLLAHRNYHNLWVHCRLRAGDVCLFIILATPPDLQLPGCPTLATSLFLWLAWDSTTADSSRPFTLELDEPGRKQAAGAAHNDGSRRSARYFVEARSEEEIAGAYAWAEERGLPLFVLGGGSNLVVSDNGFPGLVLRVVLKGVTSAKSAGSDEVLFRAAAGEEWDSFVQRAVEANCAGIECLAGIPGSVGGTPVQNVGAYGQEVASVIDHVRAFDLRERSFVEFPASECGFAYRRSRSTQPTKAASSLRASISGFGAMARQR